MTSNTHEALWAIIARGAKALALIGIGLTLGLSGARAAEYVVRETAQLVQNMPADVVDVLERADSCVHFAGEPDFGNKDRAAQLKAVIAKLRCDALDMEMKALAKRHAASQPVQDALQRARALYHLR